MEKKKNRKLRFLISCVLSFLLSALLTVGTLLLSVKLGFLNENSVLAGMAKKDYYKGAQKQFEDDAKDFTLPIGLPVEVIDGIVDSETVYDDIQNYVKASVNGRTYEFDTDELESRLRENVYDYFKSQDLEMNEEQISTLPEYTKLIADIYVEDMMVSYVNLLGKVNVSYGSYFWMGAAICFIISAVIVFMLTKMYHWKHRAMRFVIYATITTVVLVATPAVVVAVLETFMKPNISPEHLYYALVNYCGNGLKIFAYFAAGWAVITAALLFVIKLLKKNS